MRGNIIKTITNLRLSPLGFWSIAVISIFSAEVLVMFLLTLLGHSFSIKVALLDGLLLIIQVVPMLYFFLYRPLAINIRKLQQSKSELEKIQEELEYRVTERTEELTMTNRALEEEINERKLIEKTLIESKKRYRDLIKLSPEPILVLQNGEVVLANPAAARLVGLSDAKELYGKQVIDFIHPKNKNDAINQMQKILATRTETELLEYQIIRQDKQLMNVEAIGAYINFEGRPASQVFIRDVTKRVKAEETIRSLAYSDPLTGLPNRYSFEKKVNRVMEKNGFSKKRPVIMFIDLDDFKSVNDTLGHSRGDKLLLEVAQAIKCVMGSNDVFARWGGDEFIACFTEMANEAEAEKMAQSILDIFKQTFLIDGHELFISASIGIKMYHYGGSDYEEVVKSADIAMFASKNAGGNNYRFYTEELNAVTVRRTQLIRGLRQAITNKEIIVYYQPQIDLRSGKIIGVEALARWKHQKLGWVSPQEFIPIAEETGLIISLDEQVMRTACQQTKKWHATGYKIRVAINFSPNQFIDKMLATKVSELLVEAGLHPNYLGVEITEEVAIDVGHGLETLEHLQQLGVEISLDDFGTGYSSLSYLERLPINNVKIDKSFMEDIAVDGKKAALAQAIITMLKKLDLTITAEGVETEEQLNFIKEQRCDKYQGYLYSKPLPADEFEQLLKEKW